MKNTQRPLVIAMLCLAVSPLHAQSINDVKDGTSNTLVLQERVVQPVVRDSVPEQSSPNGIGNLSTRGVLTGTIEQTQTSAARQSVSVSGVEGNVNAQSAVLDGGIVTNVVQSSGGGGSAGQRVGVGSLVNSTVGSVRTRGEISGSGINQSNLSSNFGANGVDLQSVEVGSVSRTQAADVNARGSLSGGVSQVFRPNSGGEQRLSVGAVTGVNQAGSVSTLGTVSGNVTQSAENIVKQTVDVGSVRGGSAQIVQTRGELLGAVTQQSGSGRNASQGINVGSAIDASGNIRTDGKVLGSVAQRSGGGNRSSQQINVGSAIDTAGNIQTDALTAGAIDQVQNGGENVEQRIDVGSADRSTTQAVTEVVNSGDILQNSDRSSNVQQNVSIGSAENTSAVVTTRAEVTGNVVQSVDNAQGKKQSVNFGSVRNLNGGTVNTNVTVTGNVTQIAVGNGGDQSVLVGGVEGNRR